MSILVENLWLLLNSLKSLSILRESLTLHKSSIWYHMLSNWFLGVILLRIRCQYIIISNKTLTLLEIGIVLPLIVVLIWGINLWLVISLRLERTWLHCRMLELRHVTHLRGTPTLLEILRRLWSEKWGVSRLSWPILRLSYLRKYSAITILLLHSFLIVLWKLG